MNGVHKKFDQETYDQQDNRAKAAALQYIHDQGLYGRINDEDKFGPDLLIYSGYRKVSYVEVEIKLGWTGPEFPFSTVQLPERKGKFLRKRLPMEFWILNRDCTSAVVIPDYAVVSSLLREIPNSNISSGEQFYCIPLDQCNVIQLG